ncbi:MAG: SPOR domain-containing protein [Flavobacteriaceae bacterium]|nr:SPOR domain-containing protein [Flavobacteriaceae bacterium]
MKHKKIFALALLINFISFSQIDEGTVTIESSSAIKAIVAKKIKYNKSNPKIDGYRIQLFNGSESSAVSIRNKFIALFPDTATSIDWDSPEWKVRVGKYSTRLSVDKAIVEIKKTFTNAIVVEMQVRM